LAAAFSVRSHLVEFRVDLGRVRVRRVTKEFVLSSTKNKQINFLDQKYVPVNEYQTKKSHPYGLGAGLFCFFVFFEGTLGSLIHPPTTEGLFY
jgi:hypothetical protein